MDRIADRLRLKIVPLHEWADGFGPEVLTTLSGEVTTIVDVGANVGQTVSRLRKSFPEAQIYAFEPGRDAFSRLQAAWRRDDRVACMNCAVSSENGTALFVDASEMSRIVQGHHDGTERAVTCVTLDSWAREAGLSRINLLKIDAEGHDLQVVTGAAGLIARGEIDCMVLEFGMQARLIPLNAVVAELGERGFDLVFTFDMLTFRGKLDHGNALFARSDLMDRLR